jgi:alginate O-acetyltransferase complex protein AlgI
LIFTGIEFWVFYSAVFLGFSIIHKRLNLRSFYLFVISLFFYFKTSGFFFFILIVSTLVDFFIGKSIEKSNKEVNRKLLVALSAAVNLFVLVYFKYAYFFADFINDMFSVNIEVVNYMAQWSNQFTGTTFSIDRILLPVGISFYTFQTISYSVDVYRKKVKAVRNIFDFGFYVSFFPQLVAGPIVRAADFIPQIYKPYRLNKFQFGMAVFWILNGLIKKMVIGDYIAVNFVDKIFDNPLLFSGVENLLALYGYSLQVYLDFSGYTDIAIGIALLMGFRLPTNFNSPYKAKSVGEFWKRWHISLSTWLKDYLYIPLGGNRKGTWGSYITITLISCFVVLLYGDLRLFIVFGIIALLLFVAVMVFPAFKRNVDTNINLIITMLLGGLWHGASWNFVIWGGLNGLGLIAYKGWKRISPWQKSKRAIAVVWKVFLTFNFITFTRVFFRAGSNLHENPKEANDIAIERASNMLEKIFGDMDPSIIWQVLVANKPVVLLMLLGFVVHWLPSSWKWWYKRTFIKMPVVLKGLVVVLTVIAIIQTLTSDLQPFIYFQF